MNLIMMVLYNEIGGWMDSNMATTAGMRFMSKSKYVISLKSYKTSEASSNKLLVFREGHSRTFRL